MASQGGVVSSDATCFLLLPSKATSSPPKPTFNLPACGTARVNCEEVPSVQQHLLHPAHVGMDEEALSVNNPKTLFGEGLPAF